MEDFGKSIFRCRVGSHLYGFNNSNSDEDFFSVFIPKPEYFLGLKKVELVDRSTKTSDKNERNSKDDVDDKYYSISKYLNLLLQNNPNIVETLFVNKKNILFITEEFEQIMENYKEFISKRVFKTFSGYAFGQRKKLIIKKERYESLKRAVYNLKYIASVQIKNPKARLSEEISEMLNSTLKYYKGSKNNCESFHEGLQLKVVYDKLTEELNNYGWRVRTNTFEALGYDCHVSSTEFLTNKGWKKYDEIANEKLATINPKTKEFEFQDFTNRIHKPYKGPIYQIENMFFKSITTAKHRMFISPCHRSRKNNFSYKYCEERSDWKFDTVENLNNSSKSWFHLLNSIKNNRSNFDISDEYLILMGLFLTDGTFSFRNSKIKEIRLFQTSNGKELYFDLVNEIKNKYKAKKYTYERNGRNETSWIINDNIKYRLFEECGHGTENKRFPEWITKLSKRQSLLLLNALYAGDATERKECFVLYTSNKELANGFQIVALLAEKNTNLRGPYTYNNKTLYQVYYSKKKGDPKATLFNTNAAKNEKNKIRGGFKKSYSGDVVCFEVPNSTLITRLDGKIAITGNCKFAYHLIRILAEAEEILLTGKLEFPISSSFAKDIMRVREGQVEYQELLDLFEVYNERCELAYKETSLREIPNWDWANEFCIETIKKYIIEDINNAFNKSS